MSKELTPLEALENIKCDILNDNFENKQVKVLLKELNIVETALKEKEQQDSMLKTLKEVIAFAQMLPHIEPNKDNGFDIMSAITINIQRDIENRERELLRQWVLNTCFPKELKALEIIKEKINDIALFKSYCKQELGFEMWNYYHKGKELTEQEYDLLKEVLL